MATNLTPSYVKFINAGCSLGNLTQEIIDRIQYCPDFLEKLTTLVDQFESPFEIIETRDKDSCFLCTERIRTLKKQFYKS